MLYKRGFGIFFPPEEDIAKGFTEFKIILVYLFYHHKYSKIDTKKKHFPPVLERIVYRQRVPNNLLKNYFKKKTEEYMCNAMEVLTIFFENVTGGILINQKSPIPRSTLRMQKIQFYKHFLLGIKRTFKLNMMHHVDITNVDTN